MNRRQNIGGVLAIMIGLLPTTQIFAETATRATKPWHVTELLLDGVAVCDQGTWSYKLTWKPITHANQAWSKYNVAGYKCTSSTYTCTAQKCAAQISGCSTRVSASWTGVTADIGSSVSGMRLGGVGRPPDCK